VKTPVFVRDVVPIGLQLPMIYGGIMMSVTAHIEGQGHDSISWQHAGVLDIATVAAVGVVVEAGRFM
jgi:hypothetical protein